MYRSRVTGRSRDLSHGAPDDLPEECGVAQLCHHANVVRRALGLQPLTEPEFVRVAKAADRVNKNALSLVIEPEFALTIPFEVIKRHGAVSRDAVHIGAPRGG